MRHLVSSTLNFDRKVNMASKIGRLSVKSSGLFLCDMQEKFRKTISYYPQILTVSARMLQAAKVLDIPVVVTEQYPKGNISYHRPT